MIYKFTLFITACLSCLISFGQINKGTLTTNLNIGDISQLSFNKDQKNFAINPGVGYFIRDNWETGISFNYQRFRMVEHVSGAGMLQDGYTVGINLYSNYYFGKGKLKPYIIARVGWQQTRWGLTNPSAASTTHFNNHYLTTGIGAGVNWHIRPKFALFAEASYQKFHSLSTSRRPFGEANFTIGVRFFFGDKKKQR